MQSRIFFQILRQNQFSFFGSRVYKKYFSNSAESITCIYQPNLVWNSELQFSSWWFNFKTWGFTLKFWASIFQLKDYLNLRNRSWTLGFNFECEDSTWNWGFNLELQAWNLDSESWILDSGIQILDFGIWNFGFWNSDFRC